jgi:hypothetical protein
MTPGISCRIAFTLAALFQALGSQAVGNYSVVSVAAESFGTSGRPSRKLIVGEYPTRLVMVGRENKAALMSRYGFLGLKAALLHPEVADVRGRLSVTNHSPPL